MRIHVLAETAYRYAFGINSDVLFLLSDCGGFGRIRMPLLETIEVSGFYP